MNNSRICKDGLSWCTGEVKKSERRRAVRVFAIAGIGVVVLGAAYSLSHRNKIPPVPVGPTITKTTPKSAEWTKPNLFELGKEANNPDIVKFYNSDEYKDVRKYVKKYCNVYGVPEALVFAILCQESRGNHECYVPGGEKFNGVTYGIGQIDYQGDDNKVTAFNFLTGMYDTIYLTVDNISDLEINIRCVIMLISQKTRFWGGSILAAIVANNHGDAGTLEALGVPLDEIKPDTAAKFIIRANQNDTWINGDIDYLEHVLQFLPTPILRYKCILDEGKNGILHEPYRKTVGEYEVNMASGEVHLINMASIRVNKGPYVNDISGEGISRIIR